MHPEDPRPTEPFSNHNQPPPELGEWEQDPPLMGEVSGGPTPRRRKSGGGLLWVLSMIVPVVLGGVTVFGVYFLFLEDLLKPPPPPTRKQSEAQSPAGEPEPSRPREVSSSQPQPTFVSPDPSTEKPLPQKSEARNMEAANTQTISPAEREDDAANALNLAQKMGEINPPAAEKWYRRVVKNYPDTQAGQKARDWLTQQAGEP